MSMPDLNMVEVYQLLVSNARLQNLRTGETFPWAIIKKLFLLKNLNTKQKMALLNEDGSTPALDTLVAKGFFKKQNGDYVLTKSGEDFLYDPINDLSKKAIIK